MIRYYITDRAALGGRLIEHIADLGGSVDFIQIREKDLSAAALASLTRSIVRAAAPGVRVLVNDRVDIAIACGCAGVHLRAHSISPADIRRIAPREFVISVACHTLADIRQADAEGADFALFAPVFAIPGKGDPLGLERLAEAARAVRMPVLALGGVTPERVAECMNAGASGIAGIRLFQAGLRREGAPNEGS